jgi:hypothetical protein
MEGAGRMLTFRYAAALLRAGRRLFRAALCHVSLRGARPRHQVRAMSALPPKADIDRHGHDVRPVPGRDIGLSWAIPNSKVAFTMQHYSSVFGGDGKRMKCAATQSHRPFRRS